MKKEDILNALEARVAEFTLSTPLAGDINIQWWSRGIDEPPSGFWVEVAFLGDNTGRVDSKGRARSERGYIQLTCCESRSDTASLNLTRLADQIREHFPKGLQLFEGSAAVKVSRDTEILSEFFDDGKLKRPVIVRWQAVG